MADNLLQSLTTLSEPLITSFGPSGSDHLIISGKNSTITNDGATVLSLLMERSRSPSNKGGSNNVLSNMNSHPVLDLLRKCSKTQEQVAGDGTTSVVLLVGALAEKIRKLLKNYSKNLIIEALECIRKEVDNYKYIPLDINSDLFNIKTENILAEELSTTTNKEDLLDKELQDNKKRVEKKEILKKIVKTSMSSKILDPFSDKVSEIAINAVVKSNKEFERIKINKMYGSLEDISLVDGYLISDDVKVIEALRKSIKDKVRTCFIQFCLSTPKPNLDTSVAITDSNLIDELIKDERIYTRNLVRKIKAAGVELLFIQKSLTKEPVSELAEYYLKKANIQFVLLNREVIEKLSYDLHAKKSQNINFLDILELKYEIRDVSNRLYLILKEGNLLTLNITGTDPHIRDESERSIHDAMSVIRCLLEDPFYCYGGGYFELSFASFLREKYCALNNEDNQIINLCMNDLIKGIEQLPYYLAINSGYDFNLIEDLKLSLNNKIKLGVIPNLLINYNEFLLCFEEKMKASLKGESLDEAINLRKELINEKLKCFDVSEIVVPKKVVKSQIVLACELLEVVTRIDEILPGRN
ncbi:T-complex protein 1 subunit delta [Cucumispora dikerogammari]|nr:T-complex protein 1 subunit delta [Cucumispora dikerogammari]